MIDLAKYKQWRQEHFDDAVEYFHKFDDHTDKPAVWLAEHCVTITGSRIGAICGQCAYRTAQDVYEDMMCQHQVPFLGNDATEEGAALERLIAERAARVLKGHAGRGMDIVISAQPWFAAQIDSFINTRQFGLVPCEIKRVMHPAQDVWGDGSEIDSLTGELMEADSKVPRDYAAQVHWQLGVLNAIGRKHEYGLLAAYIGLDTTPRIYLFKYSPDFFKWQCEIGEKFLTECLMECRAPEEFETGKAPATVEFDRKKLPMIDLPKELDGFIQQYREASAAEKAAKEHKEGMRKIILTALEKVMGHEGPARISIDGAEVASYTASKPKGSIDAELLEKLYPEAFAACYKRGDKPTMTFRLK